MDREKWASMLASGLEPSFRIMGRQQPLAPPKEQHQDSSVACLYLTLVHCLMHKQGLLEFHELGRLQEQNSSLNKRGRRGSFLFMQRESIPCKGYLVNICFHALRSCGILWAEEGLRLLWDVESFCRLKVMLYATPHSSCLYLWTANHNVLAMGYEPTPHTGLLGQRTAWPLVQSLCRLQLSFKPALRLYVSGLKTLLLHSHRSLHMGYPSIWKGTRGTG